MTKREVKPAGILRLRPLRHLLGYLLPYKSRWIGATVALLLTSALTLTLGQGVRAVIDSGLSDQSTAFLNLAAMVLMLLTIVYAAGTYVRFYLVSWLGERVSADIRQDVFDHIVELQPCFFEENGSGEIASRLTADTTVLQTIIGSSVSMALRSSLTGLGGLVMMFITNIKLTVLVLIAVPLVVLPLVLFGRRVKHLARASQDSIAVVGSYAAEIVQNIKTVQSYTQETREKQRFAEHVEGAFEIARQRIVQRAMLMAAVVLLLFSGLTTMMWIGGGGDVISGVMSGGELAAFVFYALLVAMGMATVSEVYGELQRAAGATERLVELLSVDQKMLREKSTSHQSPRETGKNDRQTLDKLAFRAVSFAYPSRPEQPVIKDLSLRVEEGSCVALVGMSGAGKSTLFELLQRFHDPDLGEVVVDGMPLKTFDPVDLRKKLAIVSQQPVLFSGDVASNIRYGVPDASDDAVERAARDAYAHEFIQQLPEGYHSFLGEGGVRLSGGQRQRVAIARAILTDPEILLLDEATSALDSQSEHHVQQALDRLMQSRTTMVIAHRLATVREADQIVVMEQGTIVDSGTHQELLDRSAHYSRLARNQFKVA